MSSNHDALAASDGSTSVLPEASPDASDASPDDAAVDDVELEGSDPSGDAATDTPLPIQPDGPSVFTFVHGIPDAEAIRVCFAVRTSGAFQLLPVAPWPAGDAGIAYAHAASDTVVPGGVDLATTDLRPVVLTGDLSQLGARLCDTMDSPPGGVQASALQAIPAGTLSHGRSLLMAAAGCVGGPSHTDTAQETICGTGYQPDHPTVTLLVASVDRAPAADYLGLQVFTASLATPVSQVDHVIADPDVRTTLGRDMDVGVVAPQPPSYSIAPEDFGGDQSGNYFQIFDSDMPTASASVLVRDAMLRGAIAEQELAGGENFTVVTVGPRAGLGDGLWWRGFTMTLLRNDP